MGPCALVLGVLVIVLVVIVVSCARSKNKDRVDFSSSHQAQCKYVLVSFVSHELFVFEKCI